VFNISTVSHNVHFVYTVDIGR